MRLPALVAVLLLACSSSDPPPSDAGTSDTGLAVDTAPGDSGMPDTVAPLDTSSPADTGLALDVPADTGVVDVPHDTDPRASEVCRGVTAECGGQVVNVQGGVRQPDGRTLHCGGCGITCRVGESCVNCFCER